MKKNKMMRIASGLLVLNLMSTCAISGTFAKYVTKTSASDEARVAKFGVVVTASGALFDTQYANSTGNDAEPAITVATSSTGDGKKLVAPGTSSAEVAERASATDDGLFFAITGEPEVAVKVSFSVADGWKDIFMKATGTSGANQFNDYTVHNPDADHEWGTFTLDGDYHPLKFTLKNGTDVVNDADNNPLSDVTLETIVDYLNSDDSDLYFNANQNLASVFNNYNLTWKWDYDLDDPATENVDEGATANKADTFLGDYMANPTQFPRPTTAAEADISTDVSLAITVTVTQVD